MKCPLCKIGLEEVIFYNVGVNYCPKCLGLWFEKEELRLTKDEKDKNLNWLDIDLWKSPEKFIISPNQKLCPVCNLPLYEINYGNSKIKVDLCNLCQGIWLDRREFKKIIEYLKEKANYEILNNYLKNFLKEAAEIFIGPETFREEILDFLTILKILNYRFVIRHPLISQIISRLPK